MLQRETESPNGKCRPSGVPWQARHRTEDLAAEETASDRISRLEAALEDLDAYAGAVAHSLRSPLHVLRSYIDILARDLDDHLSPEARAMLTHMGEVTHQLDGMVENLLALARIDATSMRTAPVRMRDAVDTALGQFAPETIERTRIDAGRLPDCHGHPGLLVQVWANLLSNAFKFTRPGEVPDIGIGGWEEGGETGYFVRDNGIGFDPVHARELFRPFARVHPSGRYAGNGLGLAIAHRIVSRHGGRMWAVSRPGHGATFSFTLPRDAAARMPRP